MNAPTNTVELAQLRDAPRIANAPAPVQIGFNDSQGFELMQRAAKLLASSTLVPKEYQGNIPNCVIALNMALRIGADPLMVMQNLYVVQGKPGWSSQFYIATFNQCKRFSALRFEWVGEKGTDSWGCRAWAIEKSTDEKLSGSTVTIGLAKKEKWTEKNGSKWLTIPEQMLMYRAAAWFVRTHAPELTMGLRTVEEIGEIIEAEQTSPNSYAVNVSDLNGNGGAKSEATPVVDVTPTEQPTEDNPAPEPRRDAKAISYATIADYINNATSTDELDAAEDLIRSIEDKQQRDELKKLASEKAKELSQ